MGTVAGLVGLALDEKAAHEAGLNAASLVKAAPRRTRRRLPEPAQGGGLATDRLADTLVADTLAELPCVTSPR
ncbi:hypothetical protein ACWGK1_15865 [Streptomyces wedmorensis]